MPGANFSCDFERRALTLVDFSQMSNKNAQRSGKLQVEGCRLRRTCRKRSRNLLATKKRRATQSESLSFFFFYYEGFNKKMGYKALDAPNTGVIFRL